MPENFELQFIGLGGEDEINKATAETVAGKMAEKISALTSKRLKLTVHVKASGTGGKRKKYSITSRMQSPGIFLEAKSEDWNFVVALESSLKILLSEVRKKALSK